MERMDDAMNQAIQKLAEKNPKFQKALEEGKKNLEQKASSEETWERWSSISEECPYHKCDGTGLIHLRNSKTFQDKLVVCSCREERAREREIRELSQIPKAFQDVTVNSFNAEIYKSEEGKTRAKQAKYAAGNFVKNFEKFQESGKGLYFYSYTKGSGKTRLVCSVANALLKLHNVKVHFTTTTDLLDNIRKTFGDGSKYSSEELMSMYRTIDVLILDDVGVEKITPWVVEKFTQILNERMEQQRVTLFTSNIEIEELNFKSSKEESSNATERIVSRINRMAIEIQLPDENVRDYLSEQENEKFSELLFD